MRLLDQLFKDKTGKIVLFQAPNLPIVIWFVALLGSKVFSSGVAADLLSLVSFIALFVWAWLEAFYGVNFFRRILGAAVIIYTIFSRIGWG